jgi:TetR/AcrR family transcriptional regulator, transcriptional repressor of bet genes
MNKRTTRPSPRTKPSQFSRQDPWVRRQLLIDAAARCIAEGGIAAFTVDNITTKANVSRGLLNHYFPSKDDLLIEIYRASLYANTIGLIDSADNVLSPDAKLCGMVEANFSPHFFSRSDLLLWLSLWGEIAVNPRLKAVHRRHYAAYRSVLTQAIKSLAASRRRQVDASSLASSILALVDGLWIEWCLDPKILSRDDARNACYSMLEAQLGPLRQVNLRAPRLPSSAEPHRP